MKRPSRRPDWGLILLVAATAVFLGFQLGYSGRTSTETRFTIRTQYAVSEDVLLTGGDAEEGQDAQETVSDGAEAPDEEASLRVDLNTADAEELQRLPGIGPARAEAIIAYREERGMFVSVEELLYVPGIGEKVYEGVKDYVYLTIPEELPSRDGE